MVPSASNWGVVWEQHLGRQTGSRARLCGLHEWRGPAVGVWFRMSGCGGTGSLVAGQGCAGSMNGEGLQLGCGLGMSGCGGTGSPAAGQVWLLAAATARSSTCGADHGQMQLVGRYSKVGRCSKVARCRQLVGIHEAKASAAARLGLRCTESGKAPCSLVQPTVPNYGDETLKH